MLHYWGDLWRFRELFYILAWRDISVRYKQTSLGIAWVVMQPLVSMAIMTVIFHHLAKFPSVGSAPYAVLVLAAMLPWQLFSSGVANASQSLANNASIISKVYFPRLIVPAAAVMTCLADFAVSLGLLAAAMAWYGYLPGSRVLFLPFFMGLAVLAVMGPGLLLAALSARYRDVRHIIPFILQIGMYVSPVGFSSDLVRDRFGDAMFYLYALNPMVGVIDGFRWAILGEPARLDLLALLLSFAVSAIALVSGALYFRHVERTLADIL